MTLEEAQAKVTELDRALRLAQERMQTERANILVPQLRQARKELRALQSNETQSTETKEDNQQQTKGRTKSVTKNQVAQNQLDKKLKEKNNKLKIKPGEEAVQEITQEKKKEMPPPPKTPPKKKTVLDTISSQRRQRRVSRSPLVQRSYNKKRGY